jgi:predicted DNA-binding transcriptional regulator YafY
MLDASARLLRLLSMLQVRPDWAGAELARRLDVTTRTLRRDVQRLRSLGYPVHATPGVAGGYRLGAGAALPPLLLDDDEAVAVDRGDWRTFRVDRIGPPKLTGIRFVPRDPPDAAAFVANSVTAAPYRFRARVLMHAPADVIADRVPPTVGVLEAVDTGACLLTTGADALESIAIHLAWLGADFTVLEPPELIEHVRALAGRLHRAADSQP